MASLADTVSQCWIVDKETRISDKVALAIFFSAICEFQQPSFF
jgi:hypothetical protein